MRAFLTAVGTAALFASLAACGGEEQQERPALLDPSERDLAPTAYVELATGLYGDHDPGGVARPLLSQKQSECVARELVDSFKVEGLVEIKVIDAGAAYLAQPTAITEEQAEQWVGAFDTCVDLHDYAFDVIRIGALADDPEGTKGETEWQQARACVHEKVSDAEVEAVLISGLVAEPELSKPDDPFTTCVAIAYPPAAG